MITKPVRITEEWLLRDGLSLMWSLCYFVMYSLVTNPFYFSKGFHVYNLRLMSLVNTSQIQSL